MLFYRRLLHSLDNHGVRGTAARLANRGSAALLARLRPRPATVPAAVPSPHPFDLRYNTETGGWIPGEQLPSGSRSDLYNTAYYGISPSTLVRALELLGPLPAGATFVDLGCGKGRALLTAAAFPFAHLLGVELSAELCATARDNAQRMALPQVTILQQDAATLAYPAGPLVVFLYHPFLAPVLRRVLANLERRRVASVHPTWLLYANPQYPRVFARFPKLRPVWDYTLPLSEEDRLADRFGTAQERYALYTLHPRREI